MAFNAELAQKQLIDIYRRAYLDLLNIIIKKVEKGNVVGFERALLADINKILLQLDNTSKQWAEQVIPKMYNEAAEEVYLAWAQAGLEPPRLASGFGKVHEGAIRVLAENFFDNMKDAHSFIGRRIRDKWRRASLRVQLETQTTRQTLREAKKAFLHLVGDEGLGAFKDSNGRVWRLDSYAEMVIRSTSAEAVNAATLNQLRGMNRDLVQMTNHNGACEICAPLEGRVYSISGQTPGYPPLEKAYSGGFANIHPNCIHRLVPYIQELDQDAEKTKQMSNRPFDIDPRSKKEVKRYKQQQEKNRERRIARKQWESYRAWLPNDTPKTLSGFLRMKRANSEKYRELKRLYREVRKNENIGVS